MKRAFTIKPAPLLHSVFAVLLLTLIGTVYSEPAYAKKSDKCSALNQKPCPAHYIGERCDAGLDIIDGKCRPCGGSKQPACAKIKKGYPCRGNLEPDSKNICRACGGKNQKACRAGKKGEQCGAYLYKKNKICRVCGGKNEPACPTLKKGKICKTGLGKFDGKCKPCGKSDQRACPAVEQGRQCELWTTSRNGVCKPCGSPGKKACRVTDKGKPCKPGLKRNLSGTCVLDQKAILKLDSQARLDEVANEIMPAVTGVMSISQDESYTSKIKDEDPSFIDDTPDNGKCAGKTMSWTVSVEGDVAFIIGGEGEIGVAMRCADHQKNQKDLKWFAAKGYNIRPGFSAGAGASLGFWRQDFDDLRGKSHGYVFDLFQVVENATSGPLLALKKEVKEIRGMIKTGANVKPGSSFNIGFWFADYDKSDPRSFEKAGLKWKPEFVGWTLGIGKSFGWDIGGVYSKVETSQFCTADMKCAEGVWQGDNKTLTVTRQNKTSIRVKVGNGKSVKYDRTTVGGRKYKSSAGKIVRFRKNYTLLKFDDGKKFELQRKSDVPTTSSSTTSTRSTQTVAQTQTLSSQTVAQTQTKSTKAEQSSIKVLGRWIFKVKGKTHTEEIIKQTDDFIIVRRQGTSLMLGYRKTAENEYTNKSGSTIRFVNATRGIWISADKSAIYQLKKQE